MSTEQTPQIGVSGVQLLPTRGYIICCLERTGSTLLAKALSGTDMAGRPIEYFNPVMQDKPRLRNILGDSQIVEGIEKVLNAGTTRNQVFGAKLHWPHLRFLGLCIQGQWSEGQRTKMLDMLSAQLPHLISESEAITLLDAKFADLSAQTVGFEFLQSYMPDLRVIWLRRENMVARAISHYRARKSGVWFRGAANGNSKEEEPVQEFDPGEIHSLYCLGLYQQRGWQVFFKRHGISPHCVVYEDLISNYEETIRGALRFLDLDADGAIIQQPSSSKQSDSVSEEWELRYRDSLQVKLVS
jgi:LPS sulfotransferase NodH